MNDAAFPPRRILLPAFVALALTGCATKEFVQQEMDGVNKRIAGLESLLGQADQRISANVTRLQDTEGRLSQAEGTAAGLGKQVETTQADLAAANQNIAGLLMGLNSANDRIDANSQLIKTAQGQLATLEQNTAVALTRAESAAQAAASGAAGQSGGASMPSASQAPTADSSAAQATSELPADAPQAAKPGAPAANAQVPTVSDVAVRLDRVGVLIDEVHRRINVNTASLQDANARIGAVETGLATTGKQNEASAEALKAAQAQIATAQDQLAGADKRIGENTHALAVMGPHIDATAADLKAATAKLDALGEQLARNDAADVTLSATAQEALDRANAAGKLAEGRFLMETMLSESIGFPLERAGLSESARLALLAFADKLKMENQSVYIEIQGHTDNTGSAETNLRLSRQRAEAVRDFLHQQAGIPLHRLAVAAYGESRPVADNKTRAGRIKNRRVVLVVLK